MRNILFLCSILLAALAFAACGEPEPVTPDVPAAAPTPAPAPAPEVAPADPWGDVVGALALRLDVPGETFAAGALPAFRIHAKNTGTAPLKLSRFEDQTWWYHVRFESLDGGPDFQGGAGLFVDFAAPPDATLEPGATWSREADLTQERRRFLRIIPNRKPGDDWDYRNELPPGRYRAWVEYAREGREGFWTGRVRTNVVEVTITE